VLRYLSRRNVRVMLPLIAALLIARLSVPAQDSPDGFDWYWDTPRGHYNTVLSQAEPGKIMGVSQLALLDSGDLLAILPHFRYTSDAVTSDGETRWLISHDGGITWEKTQPMGSELIYGAVRLPDGTLLATGSWGWKNFPDTQENRQRLADQGYYLFTPEEGNAPGVISICYRYWMRRSSDGGQTWQTTDIKLPRFVSDLRGYREGILLRDGTYILAVYGRFELEKEKYVSGLVLRTEDGGDHWDIHTMAEAKDFGFNETSITQAANGDLVALIRTTGQRELWTAISKDSGKTWSEPRDSGLRGSTPYLVTTTDGLVVAVYIRRGTHQGAGGFTRTGVFACVSRDNGQSWDTQHQVMLVDTGTETVDGYPSAVALPDGTVYALYTFHGSSAVGGTRFHPAHPDFGTGRSQENQPSEPQQSDYSPEDAAEASRQFQLERRERLSEGQ